MSVEVYQDETGRYRWRLLDAAGRTRRIRFGHIIGVEPYPVGSPEDRAMQAAFAAYAERQDRTAA
ncbi:YegP family protein [Sandaracinobacteroides saxicola]|uniref:DUF1508 domain-containing protein n=1 Tax=Sandaracinobacteroides saxicola TaxID=2759707 RepID=A0A7G5IEB9_9SPHN|nr:hypothetical protein [Sandaracinobacteroides saxicola]QMW21711.1 hypothetical protein H3309_09820 [Sandaracinobacteroides saxicola]